MQEDKHLFPVDTSTAHRPTFKKQAGKIQTIVMSNLSKKRWSLIPALCDSSHIELSFLGFRSDANNWNECKIHLCVKLLTFCLSQLGLQTQGSLREYKTQPFLSDCLTLCQRKAPHIFFSGSHSHEVPSQRYRKARA